MPTFWEVANAVHAPNCSIAELPQKFALGLGRWHHAYRGEKEDPPLLSGSQGEREKEGVKAMKMRTAARAKHSSGAQVAFGRAAVGAMGLGALAVGATAIGALAIGALAIRALAVKRGRIERLNIEELEVGRLHVRELVVEQEQRPGES
jgi:hypothetical protein